MQLSKQSGDEQVDSKFLSYFEMPENLSKREKAKQKECLKAHKHLIMSDENPDRRYTDLVHHRITLKPDYRPRYRRPYRLHPVKKRPYATILMNYYVRTFLHQ